MWRQAVGVSLLANPKGKGRRRALPHPGAVGIHAVSGSEGDMVFWVPTGQALSPQPWVGEVTSRVWGRGAPAPPPARRLLLGCSKGIGGRGASASGRT